MRKSIVAVEGSAWVADLWGSQLRRAAETRQLLLWLLLTVWLSFEEAHNLARRGFSARTRTRG